MIIKKSRKLWLMPKTTKTKQKIFGKRIRD